MRGRRSRISNSATALFAQAGYAGSSIRRSAQRYRSTEFEKDAAEAGLLIPDMQVASFSRGSSLARIGHPDLVRGVRILANAANRPLGNVGKDIKDKLKTLEFPASYSVSFAGQSEHRSKGFNSRCNELILAVLCLYLLLASQFGSLTHPLSIMVLLPVPLISLILCMRLVTKKAILLIDDIERLRLGGKNRSAALIEAGRIRHRPMVRRTRAVIFRMVPLTLCGFHVVAQLRLGFVLARQTLA